jgi:uncharacterized protein (DUF1810 family)
VKCMGDSGFDLDRFVAAQEPVLPAVLAELRAGRKRSHWMWFVFPQLRALGRSATAQRYGIDGLAEAQAYLAHPVLGARLRECARLAAQVESGTVEQVFGYPDDLKLRSSMTLFARAATDPAVRADCQAVLDRFFGGEPDAATLDLLG